ncbi:MAG: Ig-like domain-containing protein, partial [Myxococcales bacterium]|nr:Ig-like domain-containing protein [Myxococcales bacterium]
LRSISGTVCRDVNGNGRRDPADTCEPGIRVELGSRSTTTLANGRFFFDDVAPGDHTVTAEGTASEPLVVTRQPAALDIPLLLPREKATVAAAVATGSSAVAALRVQLPNADLKVGERVALSARATFADLAQRDVSPRWTVDDPAVAKVEGDRITALTQGRTTLRADYGGVAAPPVEIIVRHLPVVGLTATPYDVRLQLGEVASLAVRGIYVNGDADDVTDQIRWETSDPDVARVEGNGVVVATGPGMTTVRGTFWGVSTAPIQVRVGTGDAMPVRLAASPATLTLGLQSTGRAYADGALASGAEVHLTSEVTWETDRPDVVDVGPGGRIRPKGLGEALVWCSYRGVRSSAMRVEVVAGVGLVVVPTLGVVPVGEKVPVKAFEVLEDGSFTEVVKVRWHTSDPEVATVEEGRIVVHRPGTAEISARYRGTEALPVVVEGVPGGLRSLEVSADRMLLQLGESGYLDSQARFTDGRMSTATSVTTWLSSDPAVATVSPDGEVRGLAPGRALVQGRWLGRETPVVEVLVDAGPAEIPSAVLVEPASVAISAQGHQALAVSVVAASGRVLPAGPVTWEVEDASVAWVEDGVVEAVSVGSTTLTAKVADVASLPVPVTVAPIVGVTASPAVGRLPVGARVDLEALAIVADGSVEVLEGQVTWTSSDPGVLRVDSEGRLLAFSAGQAEIVGRWRNIETLPIPVEVADVDLAGLELDPDAASLRVSESLPLAVVAVFTDGERADAMPHVTWTSTRPDVLAVDGGVLSGLQPGVAEVFATWMGVQSTPMRVTVAVADAVGVIVGNAAEVMPVGSRTSLRATAVTADGELLDQSEQTTWRVDTAEVARVTADGILEAVAVGRAAIRGEVGGALSPPIEIEVTDAAVLRLDILPGALAVVPGEPVDVRVRARLADGRTVDVTPLVKWEIDGPGLVADRYNTLTVLGDARARLRARLGSVRSDWATVVARGSAGESGEEEGGR